MKAISTQQISPFCVIRIQNDWQARHERRGIIADAPPRRRDRRKLTHAPDNVPYRRCEGDARVLGHLCPVAAAQFGDLSQKSLMGW